MSERLRGRFPEDWTVTLLAQDGATIADVEAQLLRVPGQVAHLVLSVGGNDALGYASALFNERAASLEAALAKIAQIRDGFARRYRQMLAKVCELEAPLAVCTIYDAVPGLGGAETAGKRAPRPIFGDLPVLFSSAVSYSRQHVATHSRCAFNPRRLQGEAGCTESQRRIHNRNCFATAPPRRTIGEQRETPSATARQLPWIGPRNEEGKQCGKRSLPCSGRFSR